MVAMSQELSKSERYTFPRLGITICVDRSAKQTTDIHVDVPKGFFSSEFDPARWSIAAAEHPSRTEDRHSICNRLHIAGLAIEILERCSSKGDFAAVDQTIEMAVEALAALETLARESRVSQAASASTRRCRGK